MPGNNKAPFVDIGAAGMNFDGLGWTPEGDVYFVYGVAANAAGVAFTASADADIDGDAALPDLGLPQGRLGRGDSVEGPEPTASAPSRASRTRKWAPASPAFGRSVF